MPNGTLFLWVNLIDLVRVEEAVGTAVPLMQLLADGEERLPGAYTQLDDDVDNSWIVIKTFGWTRAGTLADNMSALAEKAHGRRLRTMIIPVPPSAPWTCILETAYCGQETLLGQQARGGSEWQEGLVEKNENANDLGRFGRFAGWALWVFMILAAIALIVLAIWGLCATAAALDRSEAWAEWVACILFLIAFALMLHEMNK